MRSLESLASGDPFGDFVVGGELASLHLSGTWNGDSTLAAVPAPSDGDAFGDFVVGDAAEALEGAAGGDVFGDFVAGAEEPASLHLSGTFDDPFGVLDAEPAPSSDAEFGEFEDAAVRDVPAEASSATNEIVSRCSKTAPKKTGTLRSTLDETELC